MRNGNGDGFLRVIGFICLDKVFKLGLFKTPVGSL